MPIVAAAQPSKLPQVAASRIARRSRHSVIATADVTPQVSKSVGDNATSLDQCGSVLPCGNGVVETTLPASILRSRKAAVAAPGTSHLPAIRPTRSSLLRQRSKPLVQTSSFGCLRTIIPANSKVNLASTGDSSLPPRKSRNYDLAIETTNATHTPCQENGCVASSRQTSIDKGFSNVLSELQLALLESTKQRILSDIASTGRAVWAENVTATGAQLPFGVQSMNRPSLSGTISDWELSPDHPPAQLFNSLRRRGERPRRKLQRLSAGSSKAPLDSSDSSYGESLRFRSNKAVPKLTPVQQAYGQKVVSADATLPGPFTIKSAPRSLKLPYGKSLGIVSHRPVSKPSSPSAAAASHCSTRESASSAWESEEIDNEDQHSFCCLHHHYHTTPFNSTAPKSDSSTSYAVMKASQRSVEPLIIDASTQATTSRLPRTSFTLARHTHYQHSGTNDSNQWRPLQLIPVCQPPQPPKLSLVAKIDGLAPTTTASRKCRLRNLSPVQLVGSAGQRKLAVVSTELFSLHFVAPQTHLLRRTSCAPTQFFATNGTSEPALTAAPTQAPRLLLASTGVELYLPADDRSPAPSLLSSTVPGTAACAQAHSKETSTIPRKRCHIFIAAAIQRVARSLG